MLSNALKLATQMFATLSYLSSHHAYLPPSPIPSDPYSRTDPLQPGAEVQADDETMRPYRPDSPTTLASAQRELASDLVLKERQIEALIESLPGIGSSEKEQEERIRKLEKELREVEEVRTRKRKEVRATVERVEGIVMDVAGKGGAGSGPPTLVANGAEG